MREVEGKVYLELSRQVRRINYHKMKTKLIEFLHQFNNEELLELERVIGLTLKTRETTGDFKKIKLVKVEDNDNQLNYHFNNSENLILEIVLKQLFHFVNKNYKFYRFGRNKTLLIKLLENGVIIKTLKVHWISKIGLQAFLDQVNIENIESIYTEIEIRVSKMTPRELKIYSTINENLY